MKKQYFKSLFLIVQVLIAPALLCAQSPTFYHVEATDDVLPGVVSEPYSANGAVYAGTGYTFAVRKEPLELGEYNWYLEACTFVSGAPSSMKKYLIENNKPTGSYKVIKVMANGTNTDVFVRGGISAETLYHFRFNSSGTMLSKRQIVWGQTNGVVGTIQISQVISGLANNVVAMVGTVQLGSTPQRPFFANYNVSTGAISASKQYKISLDGPFGQEAGLSGLSILKFSASGFLIAGLSDADPYIMRIDGSGNMVWIRKYEDTVDGMLGITYGAEALTNMQLFSTAFGNGTYFGLLMGSLAPQFKIIKFDPATSGSILDYRKFIVPSFSNIGIPTITDADVFGKFLTCSYVETLNNLPSQAPKFTSAFVLYDLSTNESKAFSIYDGINGNGQISNLPRLIDAQAVPGNASLFTISICGGVKDTYFPGRVQHDLTLTEKVGSTIGTTHFYSCFEEYLLAPEQATSISIFGLSLLGTPTSTILNNLLSPSTPIALPVYGNEFCGSHFQSATDRSEVAAQSDDLLSISPNPASDALKIQFNSEESVSWNIFDVQGRQLLTGNDKSEVYVAVNNWKPGIYFLRYTTKEMEVKTIKFAVVR
jgi:hypothetical protein